jgi:hypothetical protein
MSFNAVNPEEVFRDSNGKVRALGIITYFDNKLTTIASIFSDEALSVAQLNPFTLDAYGRIPGNVKYSGLLTLQVSNADGSDIKTYDDVGSVPPAATGTFTPEVADADTGGNVSTGGTFTGTYSLSGSTVNVGVSCQAISTVGLTGGNAVYVRGLPFNAVNSNYYRTTCYPTGITYGGTLMVILNGDGTANLYSVASNASPTRINVGDLTSLTAVIEFSISYQIE